MSRVKTGPYRRRQHKKFLKQTKGMRGARSRRFRAAKEAVIRALEYGFADRRRKKRDFRSLWITRVNAALEAHGISYNKFMKALKKSNVVLNRKMLSELAIHEPAAFNALIEIVRPAL